ncbi:CEP44 [Mytilus edulis]|uniref:Centrosomal protein of 44 kDa n=1 Tax=Mytilus edulis TaxID=6550 RepID=A0A8S3RY57_MYTED|nr:CEP44 [Mytilus edulis]
MLFQTRRCYNLKRLQSKIVLRFNRYGKCRPIVQMSQGTPTAFLPIYHYLFTSYSHAIAEMISSSDTELYGKTDFRFIEAVYKKKSSPQPTRSSEPLVNGQRDQYTSHSPKEIRHKEIQGYMSKESYQVKYRGQTVQPDHVDPSHNSHSANYSGNTSIPSHLTSADQFSFALSPIRTLKDSSVIKPGQNTTCEDTFALEAEDDARRSSTPTDFKDLPIRTTCEDSLSFQCGDVSMQQRVDRIKNM